MEWVHLFSLIACGLLAAAPMVLAKSPNAKPMMDKLAQFGGIIGLVTLILGFIHLIDLFKLGIGNWFAHWTVVVGVVGTFCQILLGFMLGFQLLAQFFFKPGTPAGAKGEAIRVKIANIGVPLGLTALVVSLIWLLIILKIIK